MKDLVRAACLTMTVATMGGAVVAQPSGSPTAMIHATTDASKWAKLTGNVRPEANSANDRGAVADSMPVDHLLLQLKRAPERDVALKQYINDLHDPRSPNFHQWLTPELFAQHFGVAEPDVAAVTDWLTSRGFTVNGVTPSGLTIDFSGTAGQVRSALRTELHHLSVKGVHHIANVSDPQVPAALLPAITGVVSMHDFRPKPQFVQRDAQAGAPHLYDRAGGTSHALAAGDLATIYNLNPLFAAGYTGLGQSIMVVEDTYLYSTTDWTVFRKTFGLARPYPHGTLSQVSPTGALTCTNPGFQGVASDPGYGDDGEAAIDVEWATAAAPNAAIILAACTDTFSFGGLIALQNTLNGPAASLPSVVSISYGEDEATNGAAANAAYNAAYQQAVAQGVSIFVSSGDWDAAVADFGGVSTRGIAVSGLTSTPYNVSVGGTDFGYTPNRVSASNYWGATNSNTYSSALSYIQEIPWNDSCASSLVATYLGLTPLSLCNNPAVTSTTGSDHFLLNSEGGSGGPSGCATGSPSIAHVVSGTCAGYAKPSWQSGLLGNPGDNVRDVPDVALFASNGFWDAYYIVCWSNPDLTIGGGKTCNGAPGTWAGFGGTSVSSPIMAGIQALVNQKTGSRWGNPNTVYYALANTEYGVTGSSTCNSTTVNKSNNSCIFYDVTQGDNDGVCAQGTAGLINCYRPSGTYGIVSTSNTVSQPAYSTGIGWDFATGIGSVNAYNLVMGWPAP
jgi:subtilase family serine protease